MTLNTEELDILALEGAELDAWLDATNSVNTALFGRPISTLYYDRERVSFARCLHVWDGNRCVARASVSILPVEVRDPTPRIVHVIVGGGGALPEYQDRVHVHPFVLRAMARRYGRYRGGTDHYLLATNLNPIASYLLGRIARRAHPLPQATSTHLAELRRQLVAAVYPEKLGHFERTGQLPGPPPPSGVVPDRITGRVVPYAALHGDWSKGERLPMIVRFNRRDVAWMVGRLAWLAGRRALSR